MQTATDQTTLEASSGTSSLRVGIQGYAGAFHEIAARQFFEDDLAVVPAHTFKELIRAIEDGSTMDAGLMAIENTLAGSLMANYRLLIESDLRITGEVYLRIRQNLLTLPGVRLEDLEEVHSHPVAIAQCQEFFEAYPHIQLVETADTALSARDVRDHQWKHIGAIASTLAADMYGLDVLCPAIETNKQNYTRFLVLEPASRGYAVDANKISVSFTVNHEVGSLYKVLAVLAAYNVNLTKIQSAPIVGSPWEYRFYVDFVVQGDLSWEQAVDAISPITHSLIVMGAYREGNKELLK
ncbi:MAG: prephenate dehydratase [Saprospiraceae bacterium]